jgi:alcohol dehydrogenase, propanol-preferring
MRAVVLERPGEPLVLSERAEPSPAAGQVRIRVSACAVCRTDLHLRDAEIDAPRLPVVLGHQIVGTTDEGRRVGVPWLGWTDGECRYCRSGRENLCEHARFTGRDIDGGFAEVTVADERFCLDIPDAISDVQAAPLLCGGLIGYRAYRLAGVGGTGTAGGWAGIGSGGAPADGPLGLYGFGSAAHQICQVAVHHGHEVYAFTRPGDERGQRFALSLGAHWAGPSDKPPPRALAAAIIFASAGALVPAALRALAPGGTLVCAGIHMSEIPAFAYEDLWHERSIRSVANLTREDGRQFLDLASRVPVHTLVNEYPLEQAERALSDLRDGAFNGSAVLVV